MVLEDINLSDGFLLLFIFLSCPHNADLLGDSKSFDYSLPLRMRHTAAVLARPSRYP